MTAIAQPIDVGIIGATGYIMTAYRAEIRRTKEGCIDDRFSKHISPAVRSAMAGEESEHPDLEEGYRVQLFIDAAAGSAPVGVWHEVAS